MTAPLAQFDHLVVAGTTLAQAIEFVADLTGVAPRIGGQHVTMGTHNALVRLGPRAFLELIAIDPTLPRPPRARWFDLDNAALAATLGDKPRLIHWVARTDDLPRAVAAAKVDPGPVHALSRGDFRWRITVPDDGHRPGGGVLPTLIQWDVDKHPADGLPDDGVTLVQLAASHPTPETIRPALVALGLAERLHVTYDAKPRLAAMLRTPRGLLTI
ncbi:MAG: VOC family protein [Betaproteobacteria bacterium]